MYSTKFTLLMLLISIRLTFVVKIKALLMNQWLYWAEPAGPMLTHQVPQVIHAQLVSVESHWGLQVVRVDKPQVLLPQFPAAQVLILEREGEIVWDLAERYWTGQ